MIFKMLPVPPPPPPPPSPEGKKLKTCNVATWPNVRPHNTSRGRFLQPIKSAGKAPKRAEDVKFDLQYMLFFFSTS
jgi:hypothetical protein